MKNKFIPGKSYVRVAGKVFDKEEIDNVVKAAKDGWWTEGDFAKEFAAGLKKFTEQRYVTLVNSGSSANLLAVASLTSKVFGERRLKPGDEFITTAVAFPTTVNPGILYGLKPVFIDSEIDTLNANVSLLERAITKKTKLIMMAHTLGIPFNLEKVQELVKKHNLWLVEDCCDALGSRYKGRLVGTVGHISTYSFYPAHMITTGEGGAVITNNSFIYQSIRQFRDWGRDCWCDTGEDDVCRRRFGWKLGDLPFGYDHKHSFSQIGYNLKLTDFQAAVGVAQLKKLPSFIKKRKENYKKYYDFFQRYEKYFILMRSTKLENPCWFGFPLVVKKNAPFTRNQLTVFLEKHKIGTRNVFSGNLLRHPAYEEVKRRVVGNLKNADHILHGAFWLGVFPEIDDERIRYVERKVEEFLKPFE